MESQNNMHDGLLDDVVQNSQELPNRSLLHFPQNSTMKKITLLYFKS